MRSSIITYNPVCFDFKSPGSSRILFRRVFSMPYALGHDLEHAVDILYSNKKKNVPESSLKPEIQSSRIDNGAITKERDNAQAQICLTVIFQSQNFLTQ